MAARRVKRLMRVVRILIWLATLFFTAMLFVPLVQEVVRRAELAPPLP